MIIRLCSQMVGCLVLASTMQAAPIDGLYNSGATGWVVYGGSCPLGASNCLPSEIYLGSPATIPVDAALVQPNVIDFLPLVPFWNTTPVAPDDNSVWITPSVRGADSSDGPAYADTVRYLDPDIGGTMDFGLAIYEFQTTFSMVGLDPGSAYIDAYWWADGRLRASCSVQLNSTCFDFTGASHRYFQDGGNFIRIDQGFVAGDNVLSFFAENRFREAGLRVYFQGGADFSPPSGHVPEGSTWLMIAGGLGVVALKRHRG